MMYPMARTLPKKDREALTIIRLSLAVALIVSFTFLLVLLFSASWLAEASGAEAVQNYFYLLPLASLTTAWSQIASQWLVRKQAFKETAAVTVNNPVLINGIRWLAGLFSSEEVRWGKEGAKTGKS